jgi:hypothetical protein
MAERRPVAPRTFFLNETHEQARSERSGGRVASFSKIDWSAKGRTIVASLRAARAAALQTNDPLRTRRVFLLSSPEQKVQRDSKAQTAKDGVQQLKIDFGGKQARIFERLDLQLLGVTAQGEALVHARPETLDQLEATAARLSDAKKGEKARWAFLKDFRLPPIETRVDMAWLAALDPKTAHEVIVEFQPVLSRADVEILIEAVRSGLHEERHERALAAGRDLSGRRWLRARMQAETIKRLAGEFPSIQTIHAPLQATLFAGPPGQAVVGTPSTTKPLATSDLPVVAIVDAGVPRQHPHLAAYRRGEFRHAEAEQTDPGHHGSRVASRVVFGEFVVGPAFTPPPGRCRFLDVILPVISNGDGESQLDGKAVFDSLRDVARSYTDVRVFNLSFGSYVPLDQDRDKQGRLVELQDLDNFAFQYDVLVVVAAGNTRPGVIPNVDYPGHVDEPDWAIGAWAAGYNTLVVGGYVPRLNTDGVGRKPGWPSPFARVGPGIAKAPVPSFSAGAGDCADNYRWKPTLGVWTSNKSGEWEDVSGTSHAAPIVAREAALLLRELQKYCPPGVDPFASTARAFLTLVSRHEAPYPTLTPAARVLAKRTLGDGRPSADRLGSPSVGTAVFLWQGTLEGPGRGARVRAPVPRDWLNQASAPRARVVCAWNTPVNASAPNVWACRKISLQLRPSLDAAALPAVGKATGAYPLIDKTYDLSVKHLESLNVKLDIDELVLEVAYEEVAPYPPSMTIDEQQRVSIAWELFDDSVASVSPQVSVQALAVTGTMIRLGGMRQPIWSPIRIPTG